MNASKVWALDWNDTPVEFDPLAMHTVISGATRSGKSVGAYAILSQLSKLPDVTIIGIDPSSILLYPHSVNRPNDFALGTSPESLDHSLHILKWLENEMDYRTNKLLDIWTDKLTVSHVSPKFPAIVLVLEEFAGYQAALEGFDKKKKSEALRIIGRILREGSKTLVHVLAIIQRPEAATLPERSQYSRRISFRQDNEDSVRMLFEGASDESRAAAQRLKLGRCLIHEAGSQPKFATVPHLTYENYRTRIDLNHPPLIEVSNER